MMIVTFRHFRHNKKPNIMLDKWSMVKIASPTIKIIVFYQITKTKDPIKLTIVHEPFLEPPNSVKSSAYQCQSSA